MAEATHCWNCGKTSEQILFCSSCDSLQPPTTDFFYLFGFPHRYHLDSKELERRFYTLSRRLHPDVYFRRSQQERQYSLDATALLNDAYRTLRDPAQRAQYLLGRHGFALGGERRNEVPPELLEEVFELNMAIEELREGDESVRGQLEDSRAKFAAARDAIDREVEEKFTAFDETGREALLGEVRGLLNRRNYVRNLIAEVEKELAAKHV